MMRLTGSIGLLASMLLAATVATAEPIQWKVLNRFRLFDQATTSHTGVDTLLARLEASHAAGRPLVDNYGAMLGVLSGATAADLRASNWSGTRRTYDPAYVYPGSYRIEAKLAAPIDGVCRWHVDGVEQVAADCRADVVLAIPAGALEDGWGGRAEIQVLHEDSTPLNQRIVLRDLLVVAMGDSFISGEGNPDVPADLTRLAPTRERRLVSWPLSLDPDTDDLKVAEWWDEPCHRSLLSWPVTTTLAWAAEDSRRAITLVHVGCSGAEIRDGLLGGQSGLPGCPDNPNPRRHCPLENRDGPSQITQVRRLLGYGGRPIDRVLLSIGGNDIGFVGVIAFSLLPPEGYRLPDGVVRPLGAAAGVVCPDQEVAPHLRAACGSRPTAQSRLADTLPSGYSALAAALESLGVTPDKVIQTQYPDILHRTAEGDFCQHAWPASMTWNDPDILGRQQAFARAHPELVVPAGFEVTQTTIPWYARGNQRWAWQFELEPGYRCGSTTDAGRFREGSDVCGAFRTWIRLNEAVLSNQEIHGWTVIEDHVRATSGHGWCRANARFPLDMPVAGKEGRTRKPWVPYDRWIFDRAFSDRTVDLDLAALAGPGAYDPYDIDQPRWFRTSVDSFRTQYGGPGRIIQGSVHPTFRAHIAYAQAVVDQSPPLPRQPPPTASGGQPPPLPPTE